MDQLNQGNTNPGIETHPTFGTKEGILEARTRNGSRIYFQQDSAGNITIFAKSTKKN